MPMKVLRKEVREQKYSTGSYDLMDATLCQSLNITLSELDEVEEKLDENQLALFVLPSETFSQRRKQLELRDEYIEYFQKKNARKK